MPNKQSDSFFNNFTKAGGFLLVVVGAIASFFMGANNILAQKADKHEFNDFKLKQYQEHQEINKKLENHDKILIKLELMADIYLQKNKGE